MLAKVRIGGITYDVELNDLTTPRDDEIGMQLGYCHFHKGLIEINSESTPQRQAQTLIHEITHAVFDEAGLEQDEDAVNRLSLVLYQVLKDNDFSWIN